MQQISDWNILRDKAYKTAVLHGFWDGCVSDNHFLCLIVSELMEAVEADRSGKYGDLQSVVEIVNIQSEWGITDDWKGSWYKLYFEEKVKDSVGDELADALIRILDLAGRHKPDLEKPMPENATFNEKDSFTERVYSIACILANLWMSLDKKLIYAKHEICRLAESLDIDIMTHINLKMMYNETREQLHGKKY